MTALNVEQLVKNVREQIAERTDQAIDSQSPPSGANALSASAQLAASLRSLSGEISDLKSRVEIGEPRTPSLSLRGRLSSLLKSRLHRLLWWQNYHIRTLTALVAQQNQLAVEAVRLVQDSEARLRAYKEALGELQQHLARQEFAKANRSELAVLVTHYDSLLATKTDKLANKADKEELTGLLSGLTEQLSLLSTAKVEQQDLNALEERVKHGELSRIEPAQIAGLAEDVLAAKRQINTQRLDLLDLHRRLGVFLEQAKKRMPEPFTATQIQEITVKAQDSFDSLYVAFEDHFRGSSEDIRAGTKVYVPYIREALKRTGNGSVLDVACGRGEWLDLLREEEIPATGVDLNGAAIELCQQAGLQVTHEDAFTYLCKQPKNSLSAMTSFHFIEHIDHRLWIALLDEALRLLKPGGIAIFETPNARNILTAAGDFYRDPTHNRPVFPETLEVIAEMRGFFDSKAYCFNEDRSKLIPLSEYRFDGLQDYLSVSRDAVWVGIKSA